MTTTYLGALDQSGATCNGVIYKVSKEELAATDKRESAGYKRCELDPAAITMQDGRAEPPEGVFFWAYISDQKTKLEDNLPSPQFPIVQSYVDICINGCLQVEGKYPTAAGFTEKFIETTDEWNEWWVNDRIYPPRPFIFRPTASKIDKALREHKKTADLFYKIELEPASWEHTTPVRPPEVEAVPLALVLEPGAWERGG